LHYSLSLRRLGPHRSEPVTPVGQDLPLPGRQAQLLAPLPAVVDDLHGVPGRRPAVRALAPVRPGPPVVHREAHQALPGPLPVDAPPGLPALVTQPGDLFPEGDEAPVIVHKLPLLPGLLPVQPVDLYGGVVAVLQPSLGPGELLPGEEERP